ncbi:succinate dehydrogenase cytochrome b subunit [Capnocytophaga leadbetteri]|jgi:succinate dehydrogenase cytochrome B subunit, b558 family|uniref:Succinate dehydrogenase / fumarate reductase cytochrome b subunit n=1 Tax=Capnocytophaga leadbetteri TaxID=327575 RepID=A0A2T5XZ96_9FLAO|nr:succinate dehydrogenase cytochrome b subunit [Capnocytophaga leadbetteri]PTX08838.1 succinate dehydrogenase / fumarate reductase cytochrome b subunit [Capnocytophaga leadbetteri]
MAGLFKTSVARKVAMALSALFLILFLIIHLAVNLTSVISESTFNELSHFMGTNPLIQFAMQPVLLAGVIFHFVMGFVLEIQNKRARGSEKYYAYNGGANSSWMSRNMIITGVMILLFLGLHLWDFWVGEMNYKYIQFNEPNPTRYYHELIEKFHDPLRVGMYVLCFVFLCLHLLHGFQSAFQSMGWKDDARKKLISQVGNWYSYIICGGFIFIALFHYIKFLTA